MSGGRAPRLTLGIAERDTRTGDRRWHRSPGAGSSRRCRTALLFALIATGAAVGVGCGRDLVGGIPSVGACCTSSGRCTIVTSSECLSGGGFYLDDGISCDPNPCQDSRGVFVAPDGNDAYPGSPDRPKRTIAAGIEGAVRLHRQRVYIAGGRYAETVRVVAGVSILGSYVPGPIWQQDPEQVTTIVVGSTTDGLRTDCLIRDVNIPTTIGRIRFDTNDGVEGEGTYAVYVTNSSFVTLDACEIRAGSGGKGADGSPGGDGVDGRGGIGGAGGVGPPAGACVEPPVCRGGTDGAAGGTCSSAGSGTGGPGGDALEFSGCDDAPGSTAPHGEPGGVGAEGEDGRGGTGGGWQALGSFRVWLSEAGHDGSPGGCGGGGGGGASLHSYSGRPAGVTPCACSHSGMKGGYGGLGGEGGEGGGGGRGGGASIGLLSLDSSVVLQGVVIEGGVGGEGGSGTAGGLGGSGMAGNPGETQQDHPDECSTLWRGGTGGAGGDGGTGGSGGGGAGGVSFCIVKIGTGELTRVRVTCRVGSGGVGGNSSSGNDGEPGASGEYAEY